MNIKQIREIAKNYLRANNIEFEAKRDKDECSLIIKQLGNYYYVETHARYFFRDLKLDGDDYISKTTNFGTVRYYNTKPSYRFVMDNAGQIIIPLMKIPIPPQKIDDKKDDVALLDDNNLIIPIKGESYTDFGHYQIENGQATLKHVFKDYLSLDDNFLKYNIIIWKNEIYNFKTGKLIKFPFDNLIKSNNDVALKSFFENIGINNNSEELLNTLKNKMLNQNLLIGTKLISFKKDNIEEKLYVFAFIDYKGNIISMYYKDGCKLFNITDTSINNLITNLTNLLKAKVAHEIMARDLMLEQYQEELKRVLM